MGTVVLLKPATETMAFLPERLLCPELGLHFTHRLLGIGLPESFCRKPAQLRCWQSKSWCGLSQSREIIYNQPDAMCVAAAARLMLLLRDAVPLLTLMHIRHLCIDDLLQPSKLYDIIIVLRMLTCTASCQPNLMP